MAMKRNSFFVRYIAARAGDDAAVRRDRPVFDYSTVQVQRARREGGGENEMLKSQNEMLKSLKHSCLEQVSFRHSSRRLYT